MSDENLHTDAGVSHTEEVVSESVDPQSSSDATTGSTDEHLDFDTLIPKAGQKDPHNKRGGLSRREAAKLKEDHEEPEDNAITALQEELNEVKSQLNEQSELKARQSAESSFTKALEQAGVSAKEFNSQYKSDYIEEYQDFIDLGLSPERAISKALKQVLPAIKAADSEKRAEGRKRASLPPTGKPADKTVYKLSEVNKLPREEYNRVMNARDKGKIRVIE